LNRKGIDFIIIALLIVSSLLTISQAIPQAHAPITGIVCIADPTLKKCPETPPILTPALPSDKQIMIGVFVNSSASLNGFEVILQTDHTILKPSKVDLTNSIIPGGGLNAAITVQCIGGVPKPGTACAPIDNADTLHFGALGTGQTFPPTTGLLFAATYNITGTSQNTPIDFKTGCGSPSNPTSNTPICVTMTTGTAQPAPETIQRAGFSNMPYYAVDASPATLITDIGATNSSCLITVTSLNGFAGTVTLSASIAPPSGTITPSLSSSSIVLTGPGSQGFSFLTIAVAATATPGNYNVTVSAASAGLPSNSVLVHLIIPAPDFTISSAPTTVIINATSSGTARVTLTSLNAFAGQVNLTLAPSTGLAASLNVTKPILKSGGSNSSTLTVSASTGGTYTATVIAASGQLTHRIIVSVVALDFGISSSQNSLSIPQGLNQSSTFTVTNAPFACCFMGNVTLSTSTNPIQGLGSSCGPSLAVFTSSTVKSLDFVCKFSGSAIGDYTVVVGGVSRGGKLFHASVLTVHVQAPDFVITASPPIQTIQAGSTANITIIITRQSVFNGTLTLSASVSPAGPIAAFNVTSVNINTSINAAAIRLTISTASTLQPGTLTVTIKAVNGSLTGALTHQTSISITVASPSTFHSVAVGSVTTDTTSPTVGDKVKYTIVVLDLGSFPENVAVVALVGDTTVAQQNATLLPGGNATITLTWNTSGWTPGSYVVGAKVLSVAGQKTFGNNIVRTTTPIALSPTSQGLLSASTLSQLALPIGVVAALIALVGVIIFFRYRGRRQSQSA
jgi:hypothetical protein